MAGPKNGSMRPRWGIGVIVLLLVVVFGVDGVRTGLVKAKVSDDATQIAHDAANSYHSSQNIDVAYAAALAEAKAKGDVIATNDDFGIDGSGAVDVTLKRVNSTWVLGRLDASWKAFTSSASSTWTP